MRTFVTGAAGFIGSTLVDRLLADGHHVVGIDDLVSGRMANLDHARRSDGFTFIEDSVTSSALADLVATAAPEAIFHLAAQVDVRKSVDDPYHDARTNVLGTINILEASRRAGVQRIVFAASGGSRYGEPQTDLPVGEDVLPNPLSPYAAAKVAGELYLGCVCRHVWTGADLSGTGQRLRPPPGPARRGRRRGDLRQCDAHRPTNRHLR